MQTVTISASLRHKALIKSTIASLQKLDIIALFPHLDNPVKKEDVDLTLMQTLEVEHFWAIDNSEALYVICPEGYVGTLVSVEIGYARAQGKSVIFSETPQDLGLQALATAYIPLSQIKKLRTFPSS